MTGAEPASLARRRSAREAGPVVGERTWWCVVAMLGPIRVGSRHARAEWPAHVTLAGNHRLDDPSALPALVDEALRDVGVLAPRLGRMDWFGPGRDARVVLVASASVELAHERLATRLVALPGFGAEEPQHWRTGYRPHLALGRAVHIPGGKEAAVACVAIVRLEGADAVVEAVLPPPDATRRAPRTAR